MIQAVVHFMSQESLFTHSLENRSQAGWWLGHWTAGEIREEDDLAGLG
jgi:hypothetical protein